MQVFCKTECVYGNCFISGKLLTTVYGQEDAQLGHKILAAHG